MEPKIPLDLSIKQQEEKPVSFQTINDTKVQHAEHHIITYYGCMQVTVTIKTRLCPNVVKEEGMGRRLFSMGMAPQACDGEGPCSRVQGCTIASAWSILFM